jgi:hypothetical protein
MEELIAINCTDFLAFLLHIVFKSIKELVKMNAFNISKVFTSKFLYEGVTLLSKFENDSDNS